MCSVFPSLICNVYSSHLSFSLCDNFYHKVLFVKHHFLSICCQTYWLFIHSVFYVSVCYEFVLLCWNELSGIMFPVMGFIWLFYIVVRAVSIVHIYSTTHSTHKIGSSFPVIKRAFQNLTAFYKDKAVFITCSNQTNVAVKLLLIRKVRVLNVVSQTFYPECDFSCFYFSPFRQMAE